MKPRLTTIIAALCLCALAAPLSGFAKTGDWPQWRGPQRDGVSPETGLLKQWPADGPKLLWQVNDIGDGYSTPSVAGNRLYVMSNRGLSNEFAQALSAKKAVRIYHTFG